MDGCFLCGEESPLCAVCHLVGCCDRHAKIHRDGESGRCLAFKMARSKEKGRHILALRDIEPLEVIMVDTALASGPVHGSLPVCLECGRLLAGTGIQVWQCRGCGSPLCSQSCEGGPVHSGECQLFRLNGYGIRVQRLDVPSKTYQVVMTLRLLLLGADQRDMLHLLEDHSLLLTQNERHEYTENVVRVIREKLRQTQWSEEQILRYVSIVRTNACLGAAQLHKGGMRVLLPLVATMNHSCQPNTRLFQHQDDRKVTVRARHRILKGVEIFNCYTEELAGSRQRKLDMLTSWHFSCTCPRCRDPTDLGSHFDSLLCSCGGLAMPENAGTTAGWRCISCCQETSREDVEDREEQFLSNLNSLQTGSKVAEAAEDLLSANKLTFHSNHHAIISAKIVLLKEYGRRMALQAKKGQAWTLRQVRRQVELCEQTISVLNIIQPGVTSLKSSLVLELGPALFVLLRHELSKGKAPGEILQRLASLLCDFQDCKRNYLLEEDEGDRDKVELCESLICDLLSLQQRIVG